MNHRTIEIDFDIHKRIEAERMSFAESANDVLRRLLGVGEAAAAETGPATVADEARAAWTGKGVTLPAGALVRMDYNGRVVNGRIADGKWLVDGKAYSSPSSAASGSGETKAGRTTSLDGWKYWSVKRPGDDKFVPISTLRPGHVRMLADMADIKL